MTFAVTEPLSTRFVLSNRSCLVNLGAFTLVVRLLGEKSS
ncbi:Uncharacterised protein [Chlamydia trachomatis]|nr:Uncharacterised protein [Chlamydia trachomatis]